MYNKKWHVLLTLVVMSVLVLAACQPQTVIVEKEVTKEVIKEVEKEVTKVVEKEVEKEVTKVVEKEVEVEVEVTPTPTPIPSGGFLNLSSFADADILQPLLSSDSASSDFTSYMFDSPFRTDPWTGETIPGLVESYANDSGTDFPDVPRPGGRLEPTLRFMFFYSPDCPHCHEIADTVLPVIREKYGNRVEWLSLDRSEEVNYRALLILGEMTGLPQEARGAVPLIFIGDEYSAYARFLGSQDHPGRLTILRQIEGGQRGADLSYRGQQKGIDQRLIIQNRVYIAADFKNGIEIENLPFQLAVAFGELVDFDIDGGAEQFHRPL